MVKTNLSFLWLDLLMSTVRSYAALKAGEALQPYDYDAGDLIAHKI